MSLSLVYYGNAILRKKAEAVKNINQDIVNLIDSMYIVMHKANGVGLAAPQIDISSRILVVNLEPYKGRKIGLINPVIIGSEEEEVPFEEGCLSLPGISKEIYRSKRISIKGITPDEKEIQLDADEMLARVLQHEMDHLNGILFIDHLEDYLKKELTPELKKIKKLNKQKII